MPVRLLRRALTLTARLILGYTLAALLILTGAAGFLYRGLKQGFVVEDTELLSDQVEQVRGLVASEGDRLAETKRFILAAAGVRGLEKYYGRLLDEHGLVLVQTPGMGLVAPETATEFPEPIAEGQSLQRVKFWHGPEGRLSLLAAARVPREGGLTPWVFQIALDAEHVDEWLQEYRTRLYWMVGGGTMGTALLGWFVTKRGLRPLRQITTAVKEVTAHEMQGRIDAAHWPAELAVLAEEFDQMLARLRGSFDRLHQFSDDVAHEFRNPLNNLMGASSLALSQPRSAEEYRAALEANLEQFDRLKRMVESLLFIARAENAEAGLKKQLCSTAAIASDVCDFFSALAEERGIALECQGSGETLADDLLLRLALSNLLSNALKHTPRGGQVHLQFGSDERGSELVVSDTGAGIPACHHAQLFDRFYRVDSARVGSEYGTGLGLAIVKAVATLHGGTVSVASESGQGTKFRLHFPPAPGGED